MLISAFAISSLVQAPNPHKGTLTLHLTLESISHRGRHAIAHLLKEDLAKIGIDVIIEYRERGVMDDTIEGEYFNYTWDDEPNKGWDMSFWQFWGLPTDLVWFPGMYHIPPPFGWARSGWNNTEANELLMNCIHELDPVKRREYALWYQQQYVHDPPNIVLYSRVQRQCCDARLQTPWGTPGWQDALWDYDPYILSWSETPMPDKVVLKWGCRLEWYACLNPIYMWLGAQDISQLLTHSMFYVTSQIPGSPPAEGFFLRPYLAVGDPVFSEDGLTADIELRNDVYWHNFTDEWTDPLNHVDYFNEKLTADDVVCTFDALLDPATASWNRADFEVVLDVSEFPGGVEKLDDYHVRFHLIEPLSMEYFKLLMGDEWGAMILPEHIMGKVAHGDWYTHWTNTVVTGHPPPGTGPFQFVENNVAEGYWKIAAVPNYPEGLGGKHIIDEIIGYKITEPGACWTALTTHEIHFGMRCWEATKDQLDTAAADPTLTVYDSPVSEVELLRLNLRHPALSNRYVRQAIAHAINYPHIAEDIVPLVGIKARLQSTPVWPMMAWAYPTPADLDKYNIGPIEYNIDIANQYMDMWKYSLPEYAPYGTPDDPDPTGLVAQGPVGDGDFSGFVEPWDFTIWADRIVEGQLTPDEWPWRAGRDIDPDYDNSEYVEMDDYYRLKDNLGAYYPFYGAR